MAKLTQPSCTVKYPVNLYCLRLKVVSKDCRADNVRLYLVSQAHGPIMVPPGKTFPEEQLEMAVAVRCCLLCGPSQNPRSDKVTTEYQLFQLVQCKQKGSCL